MTERLSQFIDFLNISIRAFEQNILASNGLIRKAVTNKTDIQSKWLINIVDNYPQLNVVWLLTGRGEMLKPDDPAPILIEKSTTSDQKDNERIELLRNHVESLRDQIDTLKNIAIKSLNEQIDALKRNEALLIEQISELKHEAKHFESAPTASTSEGVAIPAALLTGSTPRSGKSR